MIKVLNRWIDRYFGEEEAVLVAALIIAGLAILLYLGNVLAPMIAAGIIAFLMQGMVVRLKAWGLKHNIAVTIAFVVLLGSVVVCLVFILPALWNQVVTLFDEAPRMLKRGQEILLLLPDKYPSFVNENHVTEVMTSMRAELTQAGQVILSFSVAQLPIIAAILIYLVLVPILVFFFLKDGQQITNWFASFLPKKRPVMRKIWYEMNQQIANYVRGKTIEIFIVAIVASIVFGLLETRYALLLGIATGLSVLIPYIGAAVVTLPVALIGFFQWGWSNEFLYVFGAYVVIQALDGNVLVPLLFSEAVKMHPVAIVLAVLVFGGIWGFWGVFFAIPLATFCMAIMNAWPTNEADDEVDVDNTLETNT